MNWKDWSNVTFSERHHLPERSGIYVIADINDCVWYIGQAANLKNRWASRTHHRYPQLIRSNRKLMHRIYWQEVSINCLDERERYYINLFQPELNGCKVKKYLPKQPQIEREIKRLLKVLNKPTMLFPVIRSVVAGEYKDEEGTKCILVIININDEQIISNSTRKRYANEVRKAWDYYKTYCGKDEQQYSQVWVKTYNLNVCKFEFVIADWEFFQYFEDNADARTQYLEEVEIFSEKVKALKNLSIFEKISLQEEYSYINYEGKKSLTSAAYVRYRRPILNSITTIIS
ncbi:MAG: GIY-YIG nuclease family protein [Nostoc sp. DedQUE04]|uniref:GIY-YIG nuclease family protein n=1 Tax=Nostoc sp. DedQUE04 TaxID=3075390 RepID=UPI002AD3ADB4|nr:GIY-YIG nuclease family protein [Nostoc sp. DedQUE04]MDZ8137595.1 GIY-YIG nuclease family protein [Nostoc sp. DedQUE04]